MTTVIRKKTSGSAWESGLDDTNVGAAGGDLTGNFPDPTLRAFRTLIRGATRAQASTVTAAAIYALGTGGGSVQPITGTGGAQMTAIYLQPTDWAATGYSTKLRLLVGCNVTDTAPGIDFVFGLYPVTGWAGGTTVTSITLDPVLAGSTVTFNHPTANSMNPEQSSGEFPFPTAGYYIAAVATSGAAAANSNPTCPWSLQVRNV